MTRYLQHTKTGDLYIWNEHLAARPDMREYAESEKERTEDVGPRTEEKPSPEPDLLSPESAEPDLEAMTRHELIDFAQDRFGVSLNHKDKKEALMSQVAVLLHRGK